MRQDGGLLLSVAYLWPHFVKVSVFNSGGVPTGDAGTPRPIIKDFRGSRKPQKSIFSRLETYSIESGVVDLVG